MPFLPARLHPMLTSQRTAVSVSVFPLFTFFYLYSFLKNKTTTKNIAFTIHIFCSGSVLKPLSQVLCLLCIQFRPGRLKGMKSTICVFYSLKEAAQKEPCVLCVIEGLCLRAAFMPLDQCTKALHLALLE